MVACVVALGSAVGDAADKRELKYVGSSTIGKFMADAKPRFKEKTGVELTVDTGPESNGGEVAVMTGTADLGGVAREPKPEVVAKGMTCTTVARDAIAAIVHRDNPVKTLTLAQLREIFTGKIQNWKEIGGPDQKIVAFVTAEKSATRDVFQKIVLQGEEYRNVLVQTPDAAIVDKVGSLKMAIGQISFSFVVGRSDTTAIAPNGQAPNVNNPAYPIARPLNLCTKGKPAGDALAFIGWTLSPEGQAIVKKQFIGVK